MGQETHKRKIIFDKITYPLTFFGSQAKRKSTKGSKC